MFLSLRFRNLLTKNRLKSFRLEPSRSFKHSWLAFDKKKQFQPRMTMMRDCGILIAVMTRRDKVNKFAITKEFLSSLDVRNLAVAKHIYIEKLGLFIRLLNITKSTKKQKL